MYHSQSLRTGNQSSKPPRQYCKFYPVCDQESMDTYLQNNSEGKTSVKQLAAESAQKAEQKK